MNLFDIKKIEYARALINKEAVFLQSINVKNTHQVWLHFYEKSSRDQKLQRALVRISALVGSVEVLKRLPADPKKYDAILVYSDKRLKNNLHSISSMHNPLSLYKMNSAWETFASAYIAANEASGRRQNTTRQLLWRQSQKNIDLYRAMVKIGCTFTHNILIVTDDAPCTDMGALV